MESLQIGGVDCHSLAERFGTPLYIYDETIIERQIKAAKDNFVSEMFDTEVVYASKAFSCGALYKKLAEFDMAVDVVSGGELYGAMKNEIDMAKVYFHGNNKAAWEIEMALDAGIGYFVIDNLMECEMLIEIAEKKQCCAKALLRVNPGITAHTHEYIMTSAPDSKFGIHIKNEADIETVITKLSRSRFVKLVGFHSHIGSQIVDVSSFEKSIEVMICFLKDIKNTYGMEALELSIGGGFGIKYVESDVTVSLGDMCKKLISHTEKCLVESGIDISKLITEPGRSIVGEAGYTIYTIGNMKKSGDKNYLFVDGGMSDNIRHALYDAEYTGVIAGKHNMEYAQTYCIAGKNCESGDILIEKLKLPEAEKGDLLVISSTGAYGYSMASNYNRLGRPAVAFAKNGEARLVIRRETIEDQYMLEV